VLAELKELIIGTVKLLLENDESDKSDSDTDTGKSDSGNSINSGIHNRLDLKQPSKNFRYSDQRISWSDSFLGIIGATRDTAS
jgi:hypothetical protein